MARPVPLSPTQSDMLVAHCLNPDDLGAHCLVAWRLDGPLDLDALRRTVDHLHRRHESLRCVYRMDDEPVAEPADVPPPGLVTVTAPTTAEAEAMFRRALAEPFRLDEGKVWRLVVATDGRAWHLLGLAAHHIAIDGWSEGVLSEELSRVYNALVAGVEPVEDPAPPLAAVAAEWLATPDPTALEAQRRCWREDLAGVGPLSYPGVPDPSSPLDAEVLELHLPGEALERAARLARKHRVTPYAVLLMTYGKALAEAAGQLDFCVGTPVALRGDGMLDRAVACLIDVLCIRLRFRAGDTEAQEIAAVSAAVRRAFAGRGVSVNEIARLVNLPRDGRPKIFQNMFALQNHPYRELDISGTRSESFPVRPFALPTELFVEVGPDRIGGACLAINFQPTRVPRTFVRHLASGILSRLADLGAPS